MSILRRLSVGFSADVSGSAHSFVSARIGGAGRPKAAVWLAVDVAIEVEDVLVTIFAAGKSGPGVVVTDPRASGGSR
jgi:hypothetical protein